MATSRTGFSRRNRAKARIVEATRQVLLRDGISALTVEAVADHAGVSKPSVYYYFDSKDALIRELVLGLAAAEQQVMLRAVQDADDGPAVIGDLVRAYVQHHLQSLELFKVQYLWSQIMGFGAGDGDVEVNRGMIALYDAIEGRLARDHEAGHLRADAHPRRLGVVAWMAAQGVVHTFALLDSAGTSLSHGSAPIVDELVRALTDGAYPGRSDAAGS